MAKSKNHTNHNQNRKAHRNGIKRPKVKRHESTLGVSIINENPFRTDYSMNRSSDSLIHVLAFQMDAKFLINQRYARKGNVAPAEAKKRFEERKKETKPAPIKL